LLIEFIDCIVITGDMPTGLYSAYRFDVCSWNLRPSEGREKLLYLVDFAGVFECWCDRNVWTSTTSGSAWQLDDGRVVAASMDRLFDWVVVAWRHLLIFLVLFSAW